MSCSWFCEVCLWVLLYLFVLFIVVKFKLAEVTYQGMIRFQY